MSQTTAASDTTETTPTQQDAGSGGGGLQQGADAVKEHAGATMDTAREQAGAVMESATDHARTLVGTAGEEMRGQVREQSERLSRALADVSEELARMAEQSEGPSPVGQTVRTLSEAAGRLSHRLEEGGAQGVLSDVAGFARRRPGTFLFVSAATGFVVGRLARSTDTSAVLEAVRSTGNGTEGPTERQQDGDLPDSDERVEVRAGVAAP